MYFITFKGGINLSEIEEKKIALAIYVDAAKKQDIDDFIFEQKIRNFQDAYREILDLGFEQFKKIKKGGKS